MVCKKCSKNLSEEDFYIDKRRNKLFNVCKCCQQDGKKLARLRRKEKDPEAFRLKTKYYNDKHKAYYEQYWKDNPDKKSEIQSKYYKRNIEKEAARHRQRKASKKKSIIESMGNKCSICQNSYPLPAYDFHHLNPEDKEYNISTIYFLPEDILERELAKCILVCANCHRVLHYETD